MAIDYNEFLSSKQKKDILQQRIVQFATEAYQLNLNLKVLENEEQKNIISKSLSDLEKAIQVHKEELAKVTE